MKKHNGIISLWKFLFAIVIVFFHGNCFYSDLSNPFFKGGYIAVEFFFITSGFYFAKSTLKEKYHKNTIGKETFSFIIKKIKSFMHYIIIIFILNIIFLLINNKLKTNDIINSIWNLLLLREFGFRAPNFLGQLWYLSSMIFAMFILYPLLKKHRDNFILIASPTIIILGLGYLSKNWLGLDHAYNLWTGFCKTGILRGLIEINIGMIIYYINKKLKNIEYTKLFRIILTITSELLLITVLFITTSIDTHKYYDYIMLLFISIAILIIVSEKTYEYKILSNKLCYYLEKLSLPIFINHTFIIDLIKKISISPIKQSITTVFLTIIFSIIELFIIDKFKNLNLLVKIKKLIIKNEF